MESTTGYTFTLFVRYITSERLIIAHGKNAKLRRVTFFGNWVKVKVIALKTTWVKLKVFCKKKSTWVKSKSNFLKTTQVKVKNKSTFEFSLEK